MAVEAHRVAVYVVAAVVVVAVQMADQLEVARVAKGGSARGIAERGLELREGDASRGSQPCGQHVGGAFGHDDTACLELCKVDIQYQNGIMRDSALRAFRLADAALS